MRPTDMAYTTWQATLGNGVRIGMALITIVNLQLRTRQGRAQAPSGCCGVVVGTSILATCGWLTASTTAFRIIGTSASGFDVCQDRLNYPWPHEARAFTSDEGSSFTTGRGVAELVGSLIWPSAWDIKSVVGLLLSSRQSAGPVPASLPHLLHSS